jgi:hypothetical protein
MSYTREPIRMSGVLRGSNGLSSNCMVSALRVTLEGTRLFKDCQLSIVWISRSLPDGDYRLSFNGKIFGMRLSKEAWRTIQDCSGGSQRLWANQPGP